MKSEILVIGSLAMNLIVTTALYYIAGGSVLVTSSTATYGKMANPVI